MAKHVVEFGVEAAQRTGDAKLACSSLAGRAAAVDFDPDVYGGKLTGLIQGVENLKAIFDSREIVVNRSLVNQDFTATCFDADSSDRGFATASGQSVSGGVCFGGRGGGWSGGSGHEFIGVWVSLCLVSRRHREPSPNYFAPSSFGSGFCD